MVIGIKMESGGVHPQGLSQPPRRRSFAKPGKRSEDAPQSMEAPLPGFVFYPNSTKGKTWTLKCRRKRN